jgi:hypothetical protein
MGCGAGWSRQPVGGDGSDGAGLLFDDATEPGLLEAGTNDTGLLLEGAELDRLLLAGEIDFSAAKWVSGT